MTRRDLAQRRVGPADVRRHPAAGAEAASARRIDRARRIALQHDAAPCTGAHRIGQRHDVWVFNFVATNTVEGRIIDTLLTKMQEMRRALGERVFDVIGLVLRLNDVNLEDMLREEKNIGGLNYEVPAVASVCAQDLVKEAYKELRGQKELEPEYQRAQAVAERYGY